MCETVYQFTVHRKTERTAQTAHRLLLLIFFFVFCFSELLLIRAKVAAVFAFAAAPDSSWGSKRKEVEKRAVVLVMGR